MFDPRGHLEAIDAQRWAVFASERKRLRLLFDEDPAAFDTYFHEAWRFFDTPRVAAAGSVRRERGVLFGDWALATARSLIADGRVAEALGALSSPEEARRDSALFLYHRARVFAAAGEFGTAKAELNTLLELAPEFAGALARKGEVKRLQRLLQALEREPNWPDAALAMAEAYQLRSEVGERQVVELLARGPVPISAETVEAYDLVDRCIDVAPVVADQLIARREAEQGRSDLTDALRVKARLKAGEAVDPIEPPADADWRLRLWNALAAEAAGDTSRALAEVDALSGHHDAGPLRQAIAFCTGKEVLSRVSLQPARKGPSRVINLFPFNDEFVLLRARLEEMSWVDRFVLVEARQTFTGMPKPLAFNARKAEFADFAHKLTHVIVDAFPAGVEHAWARDFYQRDYAIAGLGGDWSDDDLILLTDVDEIVDLKALEGFRGDFARLKMNTFKYFFNYRPKVGDRRRLGSTGAVCRARLLRTHGSSYLRFVLARLRREAPEINKSGWHFTSVAEPEAITRKLRSYAHQEAKYAAEREDDAIANHLRRIRTGEFDEGWERVPLDESFPAYIRENAEALAHLIL